jgi:hypothetical protein
LVIGFSLLAVGAGCGTELYDVDRNPDEFVGLPAATLMPAGGAGVVGSLLLPPRC